MSGKSVSRRQLLTATAASFLLMCCPWAKAVAADYPTQPVRLLLGSAASGIHDLVARLIAPVMEKELGQPVIVENKPGAAQKLALGLATSAKPDGHILFVSSSAMMATAVTHAKMPADPLKDLEHISMIAEGFFTFAINPKVEATTTAEFIALAQKNPKMTYGASGIGSAIHLAGELFLQRAGIKMRAVQYTSSGQRTADALANEIQMTINAIQVTGQYIETGALRGLFVASKDRESGYPNIPSSYELGLKDLDRISNWFGLHAPKDTPKPILKKLHAAVLKAINDPMVRERLISGGLQPIGNTPEEFTARLSSDQEIYREIAREAKISVLD